MLNVYRSVKRDIFLVYMNDVASYIITEYFNKNIHKFNLTPKEIQMLIKYYKCVFVGVLMEWLDHGLESDLAAEMRQIAELLENHPELQAIMNRP